MVAAIDDLPGQEFEGLTAALYMRFPGARVDREVRVAGKKVDVLVTLSPAGLPRTYRIALECKDYNRRLTRVQVAAILADYWPLLSGDHVDYVYLVTRNGLGPSAKEMIDNTRVFHFEYEQLITEALAPSTLIDAMKAQFRSEGLDQVYVPVRCQRVSLEAVAADFEHFYNPFIDEFCRRESRLTLKEAATVWKQAVDDPDLRRLPARYTARGFEQALGARRTREDMDVERFVLKWMNMETSFGLALLGSYGTGKSSFARKFATLCAERYEAKRSFRIPLLVELRHFSSDIDIAQLITHHMINMYDMERLSFERFQILNRAGKFVIILDGFDEMKHGSTKESIAYTFSEINRLSGGRSKVVLCGRPTLFEDEVEQMAILTGDSAIPVAHHASYLPIQLNQFTEPQMFAALRSHALAAPARDRVRLLKQVDLLPDQVRGNSELRELLARPVHIQMVARILPTLDVPLAQLSRARLYRRFINLIIDRELAKPARNRILYTTDQRREFASRLAVEMIRIGDSRTIRQSAITEPMLAGFRRPGIPIDAIRRDLVSACFLERKPPDLLYFGHKSFGEYLAAERLNQLARMSRRTDRLGITLTPEVASFVSELLDLEDWVGILVEPIHNGQILRTFFKAGTVPDNFDPAVRLDLFLEALTQDAVIDRLRRALDQLPVMVQYQLAEMAEMGPFSEISVRLAPVMRNLLSSSDDFVAVHAHRALARVDQRPALEELQKILDAERFEKWRTLDWISDVSRGSVRSRQGRGTRKSR